MKKQSSILSFALSLFFFSVITGSHAQAQQAKSDVSVSRSVSAGQHASDGRPMVVVTITINKYAYTGPGRIEESFSSDFQATLISASRATFQTNSGKATFIWNNIQEDRVITVSYALEAMTKTSENQTVSGQFFYENQTFSIDPTSFTIDTTNLQAYKAPANNGSSTLDDLFSSVTGTPTPAQQAPAASTPAPAQTPVASTPAPAQQMPSASTPAVTQETPMASTPAPAQQMPSASTSAVTQETPMASTPAPAQQMPSASTSAVTQETPMASTPAAPAQQMPSASTSAVTQETPVASTPAAAQQTPVDNTPSSPSSSLGSSAGLVYRVQIIVVGDKSKLPQFLKQHKITDQVYYDPVTDVPVRVMVGNYADYNSAKARCSDLRNKGLTEAFVAPYYMGERVTIDEAAAHAQH